MLKRLTVMTLIVLSIVALSLATDVAAEEAANRNKEARLMAGSQPKRLFPEIEKTIERAAEKLAALRHEADKLEKEGGESEKLEKLQQKVANDEAELEKLRTLLERRKTARKQRIEKEARIKKLQGAIKEHKIELERLTGELRRTQQNGIQWGKLVVGWVVSGSERDVTIKVMETGKIIVLRVPKRRRVNGKLAGTADLSYMTARLHKDELILARYNLGDERGAYFLQQIKILSLAENEANGQAGIMGLLRVIERRLARVEEKLGKRDQAKSVQERP